MTDAQTELMEAKDAQEKAADAERELRKGGQTMTGRLRVYVAGAYDGPSVVTVQANMRRGLRLSYDLLRAGYAPFAPWLDFQFGMLGPVERHEYLAYSIAWLEAADAMIVVPEGAKESRGTQAEVARARALQIPVFGSLAELQAAKRPPGDRGS